MNDFTGGFALRPDGRQIAFVAGEFKEEVVALEHVVLAASAGRR